MNIDFIILCLNLLAKSIKNNTRKKYNKSFPNRPIYRFRTNQNHTAFTAHKFHKTIHLYIRKKERHKIIPFPQYAK